MSYSARTMAPTALVIFLLGTLAPASATLGGAAAPASRAKQPNIVFILAVRLTQPAECARCAHSCALTTDPIHFPNSSSNRTT